MKEIIMDIQIVAWIIENKNQNKAQIEWFSDTRLVGCDAKITNQQNYYANATIL